MKWLTATLALVLAFLAGRWWPRPAPPVASCALAEQAAVLEYRLTRTEAMLEAQAEGLRLARGVSHVQP